MTDNQRAEIVWRDGWIPVSARFKDPYFSVDDGLAETKYVFLRGNRLPARLCDGFQIAELGFGTGLNMLAVWDAWLASGQVGSCQFTSFEAFPLHNEDMAKALEAFPNISDLAQPFLELWAAGARKFSLPGMDVEILIGDARDTLRNWPNKADAWFLDGFAPALNPELWQSDLMLTVADHTTKGGTLATYTAAGAVRRALEIAGFEITRIKGFGRKRHMTIGTLL